MRFYVIFVLVISFMKINAQDSIPYSIDLRLYEGVYFSYQDFRFNWPIPKEKIISKINKDQLDFYTKLIEEEFIEFTERDGSVSKIKSEQVWGYCQNNVIFINQNKNFYRIPVFGSISNFIGTQEVINYSPGFDPFMNAPMSSSSQKVKEIRQFLFDFYTGEIALFSIDKLEEYFKRDIEIYKQFTALNKKKKKEQAVKFIRLYNEKHIVYFPKG